MKTMKYIATVLMLLSMTSCELERLDYTEISPENFFKTETDLKLAVNSLYYDFNSRATVPSHWYSNACRFRPKDQNTGTLPKSYR